MAGFIFGAPGLPKTQAELDNLRKITQAMALRQTRAPSNIGEGLNAIGQALVYRGMMNDLNAGSADIAKQQAAIYPTIASLLSGGAAATPATPAPTAPAAPPANDTSGAALSPAPLSQTPQPLSGGLPQNSAALTNAVATLESGNSPVNGPAGGYANYRFQQFPAFAKQYGSGEDGVVNYAKQVLAANPNATFGDLYGGYVTGTGNPATAKVASLQTTTQPGAQGAYGNLVRNSPVDPKTPLSQLMGTDIASLLGPASAYADTPKPGDTLLQQPQPSPANVPLPPVLRMAGTDISGLTAPGNIDLNQRPVASNPDGSISTVRSITVGGPNGSAILLPTVIGGRVVSNEDAIRHYQQTGENLGTFANSASADKYAESLHNQQAAEYLPQTPAAGTPRQQIAQALTGGFTPGPLPNVTNVPTKPVDLPPTMGAREAVTRALTGQAQAPVAPAAPQAPVAPAVDPRRQAATAAFKLLQEKGNVMDATQKAILGKIIEQGMAQTKGVNVNGHLVDPQTGREIADFSQTPNITEYNAAKAQGFKGTFEDWMKQKAAMGRQQTIAPPEKGMRYVYDRNGNITAEEPIAGGSVDRANKSKEAFAKQQQDIVLDDIRRSIPMADGWTTGVGGAAFQSIPGTSAFNLHQMLQGIKANVGFDRLQQMRSTSPTGGALGQVSEQENRLLQSTMGSLEQAQNKDQFLYNLKRLHNVYMDTVNGTPAQLDQLLKSGKITQEQHDTALAQRYDLNQGQTAPKPGSYRFNPATGKLEPMQ